MDMEIEPSEAEPSNSFDSDNEKCKKCGFNSKLDPPTPTSSPEEHNVDTSVDDVISSLLQTPLLSRPEAEQCHIIVCLGQPLKLNKEVETLSLNHKWLCNSSTLQKLFCWPCVVVSPEKNEWCESDFDDFSNITESACVHEDSKNHIENLLQYVELKEDLECCCKDLTCWDDDDEEENPSIAKISKYSEDIEQNRRLLRMLITTVLCVANHENSDPKEVFKYLLNLVMMFAPEDFVSHYKKIKPIFLSNTKAIQDELVEYINEYIIEYIKKELQAADMFAVRLDSNDHAIMVRFINMHGQLVEHFLGFHTRNFPATWGIFHVLDKVLEPFDYKNKLVGQCYDSGYITGAHLNELQEKIKEEAPQAAFVYCIEHRLSLLLEQVCERNLQSLFFVNFRGIYKLTLFFQRFLPDWPSETENMFEVVVEKWDSVSSCLDNYMINRYDYNIYNLQEAMQEFEFAFLSCFFAEIFAAINPLYNVLKEQSLDVHICLEQIQKTCRIIRRMKQEENCQRLFETAKSKIDDDEQDYNKYKKMFDDTLDNILFELYVRFQDMSKLSFVALTDSSKFEEYAVNFPSHLLPSLQDCFPKLFPKIERLKHELEVFYGEEIYYNEGIRDVINILRVNDVHKHVLTEVYKLFCLVATLPSTYMEDTFSSLQNVKTCARYFLDDDIDRNKYFSEHIGIQKNIIDDLSEEEKEAFYNRIIDKFAASAERAIDLI